MERENSIRDRRLPLGRRFCCHTKLGNHLQIKVRLLIRVDRATATVDDIRGQIFTATQPQAAGQPPDIFTQMYLFSNQQR